MTTRAADLRRRAEEYRPDKYYPVPKQDYRRLAAFFRRYGHVGPPYSNDSDGEDDTGHCGMEYLTAVVPEERAAALDAALDRAGYETSGVCLWDDRPGEAVIDVFGGWTGPEEVL
jgi:hypothetical protein